jgi:hypothetical protein
MPSSDQLPDPSQIPQPGENPAFDEVVRRLAERARDAQNQQEQSERLRELARQLADNMSPEQRRRWAEMLQREMGNPPPPSPQASPPSPDQQPRDPSAPQQNPQPDPQEAAQPQQPQQPENRDQGADRQDPSPQPGDQPSGPPPSEARDNGGDDDDRNLPDASRSAPDLQRPRSGRGGNEAGTQDAGEARDPNAPPLERDSTDTVDLRGEESAERLIAQWLSDTPPESADSSARTTGPASAAAAQRVQQAQKVAERAVNDSAVNKRYHRLIQRYFGRLPDVIEQAARGRVPGVDAPAPAAPEAPEARPAAPPSTQPS